MTQRNKLVDPLVDLLIWWLNPDDLYVICGQAKSGPKTGRNYINRELISALGRNGRWRLWINEYIQKDFSEDEIEVKQKYWLDGLLAQRLAMDYAGIVIRIDDYKLVKDYPGIFTDLELDRYPDYRICGK